MTDAERGQVTRSAANVYDEFFVPALFGQWTDAMLDAASVGAGHRVLDVGCGTGVVAAAAAERVGRGGRVAAIDRNEGMLDVARAKHPDAEWQRAVAEQLPYEDGQFDSVICQFALMFFDDRRRALDEIARVLRPGGTLAAATWASIDESPGYSAMVELLDDLFGATAAGALRAPFCLGNADQLRTLVADAFPDVDIARVPGEAAFDSIEIWIATEIRGWTLAHEIDDEQFDRLLDEAGRRLAPFADRSGRVRFPAPALIATAHRPGVGSPAA